MGAPPKARIGEPAASAGRPIVAGVAPFLKQLLSTRHAYDLWTSIEAIAASPAEALRHRHGTKLDQNAERRFSEVRLAHPRCSADSENPASGNRNQYATRYADQGSSGSRSRFQLRYSRAPPPFAWGSTIASEYAAFQ